MRKEQSIFRSEGVRDRADWNVATSGRPALERSFRSMGCAKAWSGGVWLMCETYEPTGRPFSIVCLSLASRARFCRLTNQNVSGSTTRMSPLTSIRIVMPTRVP